MEQRPDLWPEVTSPLARRVLKRLCAISAPCTGQGDYNNYDRSFSESERAYQRWLRFHLERSTLAQQLADGPGMLPDISEAMPGFVSMIYRLIRPRTYERQMSFLLAYLDWYVEPSQRFYSKMSCYQLIVVAFFLGVSAFCSLAQFYSLAVVMIIPLAAAVGALVSRDYIPFGAAAAMRRLINATELYWYLLHAYADSDGGTAADSALPRRGLAGRREDSIRDSAETTPLQR